MGFDVELCEDMFFQDQNVCVWGGGGGAFRLCKLSGVTSTTFKFDMRHGRKYIYR